MPAVVGCAMVNKIERAISAMWACACPSDYDAWFKLLCAIKSAGVPKDEARHWCESGDGFIAADFESKWERGIKEGGAIKAASLFATAFSQGWKDPSKSRPKGSNGTRPNLPLIQAKQTPQTPVKQAGNSNAAQVWSRCIPATDAEAYIHKKQGKPDGLKVYPASASPLVIRGQNVAGYLAVPCWSGNDLQTLQFIPPDGGDKLNLPGASFADGFFVVGNLATAKKIFIVEGVGQAWATTKADPASAAVVCFGAGRMARIAKLLRDKYPVLKGGSK